MPADHHHAGLTPAARREAETAFTGGHTPVLVCTSTLELGLNLPCRRVVLYDLNEWNGQSFAPLPVRNAWQRAGRAGRYGLDVQGEVIVLRAAWDRNAPDYPSGQFEPVRSALSSEAFVLEQLVADVGSGLLRSRAGLDRFYARTLAARQGRLPPLLPLLTRALEAGLLTEEPLGRRRLGVTPAGKVAARHLLAPETVLRWTQLAAFTTPFDLLLFTLTLPDVELRLPVDYERLPELRAAMNAAPSRWLRRTPAEVGEALQTQGRALLHALHTACALWSHLNGEPEDRAAERVGAYPFELCRLRAEGVRVLTAAQQWLGATRPDPAHPAHDLLVRRVGLLRAMLDGPLDEAAATLTRVSGIGPRWASVLSAHGIGDLEALALCRPVDLRGVPRLGAARAAQWTGQAEELVKDWTEVWEAVPRLPPPVPSAPSNSAVDPYRLKRAATLTVQRLDHAFRVTGGQEPHLITRRGRQWRCDCADHAAGQRCKHVLAVNLQADPELRATLDRLGDGPLTEWALDALWMHT